MDNTKIHPKLKPFFHLAELHPQCGTDACRLGKFGYDCCSYVGCGPGCKCLEEKEIIPCRACLVWRGYHNEKNVNAVARMLKKYSDKLSIKKIESK